MAPLSKRVSRLEEITSERAPRLASNSAEECLALFRLRGLHLGLDPGYCPGADPQQLRDLVLPHAAFGDGLSDGLLGLPVDGGRAAVAASPDAWAIINCFPPRRIQVIAPLISLGFSEGNAKGFSAQAAAGAPVASACDLAVPCWEQLGSG
jgi:hypothetical protein